MFVGIGVVILLACVVKDCRNIVELKMVKYGLWVDEILYKRTVKI